jgi:uncharacterized protein (DUF2384 family)
MDCIDATQVYELLSDLFTLEEFDDWLDEPHKLLGGRSPQALISTGQLDEVIRLATQIREGVYL